MKHLVLRYKSEPIQLQMAKWINKKKPSI